MLLAPPLLLVGAAAALLWLLPAAAAERTHVLSMALTIACDIHPLNNLRVLKYLKGELGQEQDAIDAWYAHWIGEGLPAVEAAARQRAGNFLLGDQPTIADVCLIPQLYNARRYELPLDEYPTLLRAEENANKLEAFAKEFRSLLGPNLDTGTGRKVTIEA